MKLLVHGKADVNMEAGRCGRTALHFAANTDNLSMVGWLLLEVSHGLYFLLFGIIIYVKLLCNPDASQLV